MRDPVCVLVRNLYGHPLAGNYWQNYCEEQVAKAGFERVHDAWPSFYKHKLKQCYLIIYVDDFRMAGRKDDRAYCWAELRKHVKLTSPELWGRYLGVQSVVADTTYTDPATGTTRPARTLRCDMTEFARSCVDRYTELTGVSKFTPVQTPFLDETKIAIEDYNFDDKNKGQLADHANSIIMKLLWLGRMSRWDLLRQICLLAGQVSKWSVACDRMLHRLIAYLHHTVDHALSVTVGNPSSDWELHLYTDADLAKCPFTKRSTSGVYLEIKASHTLAPVVGNSIKQTAMSESTPEAELVAASKGIRVAGIPILLSLIHI